MKKLKDRWITEQGSVRAKTILDHLVSGHDLSTVPGTETHEGRLDLRGLNFPIALPGTRRFEIKNATLSKVDFSFGTLYETEWMNCSFNDVRFDHAKLDNSRFWACKFDTATFSKTYLNNVLLNGTLGNDSGYFRNVVFDQANMKGTYYTNTLFNGCTFSTCKLRLVDFNGSRFENSTFIGPLEEVFFHGVQLINPKLEPNRKPLPNKMLNVDFTQAELESVSFLDDIDLSHCKFPESPDYLLIRNYRNYILDDVRKEIGATWEGTDKTIALTLLDQAYLSKRQRGKKMDFLDKHYLKHTGEQFAENFFELVRKFDKKYNPG